MPPSTETPTAHTSLAPEAAVARSRSDVVTLGSIPVTLAQVVPSQWSISVRRGVPALLSVRQLPTAQTLVAVVAATPYRKLSPLPWLVGVMTFQPVEPGNPGPIHCST